MLQTFLIKNYAIIDDLTIDFGKGLNILTGETGAGKSIIIDALGLILGERSTTSIIRKDASSCVLTACFNIENLPQVKKALKTIDIAPEDTLIIKREIFTDGKTKCFVNGNPVTVGMLQTIGSILVDIHGQHEHQSLIKSENQREMLDGYGDLEKPRDAVGDIFEKFISTEKQLNELKNSEKDRLQKLDLYKYQLKEIDSAKLSETDDKELENEFNRLNNSEKLSNYAQEIYSLLYESEGAVVENLGKARKLIETLSTVDSSNSDSIKTISQTLEEIKAVAETFRRYKDTIEFNPKRLEEIISQIELIKKLKRKYAPTAEEILEYAEKIRKQINLFEKADENISAMEKEIKLIYSKLKKTAIELSEKRSVIAKELSKKIEKEFSELGMAKSRFSITVEQEKDDSGNYRFKSYGIDKIEYKIAPNVGENLKPIKVVASGGEMSRVMLAIKTVLAKADEIPTLIFDEIDAGISGPIGQVVGKKLNFLAKNHQIFCITHLPQLAAFSSTHFHISKKVSGGKTITSVTKLSEAEKTDEISRMLGGQKTTDTSIKHAEELIKETRIHANIRRNANSRE
ncbi:MAG: DNA repair protein RecN [Elusimicrobia bacterium]|nr:DNA repair protein RecN [Elusimicrobiota bacterium]